MIIKTIVPKFSTNYTIFIITRQLGHYGTSGFHHDTASKNGLKNITIKLSYKRFYRLC